MDFYYRMKGIDGTLHTTVYWMSLIVDLAAADYTGPGPVTDVTVVASSVVDRTSSLYVPLVADQSNLITTLIPAITATNTEPATALVPVQNGPVLASSGYAWQTGGGGSSVQVQVGIYAIPVTAAVASVTVGFATKVGAGAWTPAPIGGIFLADDGSALVPSYSFTTDQNTGMYKYAGDSIGFTTGGTVSAKIESAYDCRLVPTIGLTAVNDHPAEAGAGMEVQYGPIIASSGSAWESTGGTPVTVQGGMYVVPATGATATAQINIARKIGAAAWSTVAYFDAPNGSLYCIGNLSAGLSGTLNVYAQTVASGADAVFSAKSNMAVGNLGNGIQLWNYAGTRAAGNIVSIGDGVAFTEKAAFNYQAALTIHGAGWGVGGIGTTQTAGLSLVNTTAAAPGAQQSSPMIFMSGQGHATTPVNSQSVDFAFQVVPVQGAATPDGYMDLRPRIDGGAWGASAFRVTVNGHMAVPGYASCASVQTSGTTLYINGGSATTDSNVLRPNGVVTKAAGTFIVNSATGTFSPAAGTAKFVTLSVAPIINQAGGCTGDYTALEVNSTETSALGTNKLLMDLQLAAVSKFRVTSAGRVGMGVDAPLGIFHMATQDFTNVSVRINGYSNNATDRPRIFVSRGGGTVAAPSAVAAGDWILADIAYAGYWDATNQSTAAQVQAVAEEAWSGTNKGTRLEFKTIKTATATLQTRLVIAGTGNIGIGVWPDSMPNPVATLDILPAAVTTGAATMFLATSPANTGQTAGTEIKNVYFNLSATREWATGDITTQREMLVAAPTYSFVGASTVTNAVTLEVNGAPIAGANAVFTNANIVRIAGTFAPTAGTTKFVALNIQTTINQTAPASGDYTSFQVNTTETSALGSSKLLMDLQLATVSKFKVTSAGAVTAAGSIYAGGGTGYLYGNNLTNSGDAILQIESKMAAANAGTAIVLNTVYTRTAGFLLDVQNNGSTVFKTAFDGRFTQTTIASLARTAGAEFIGSYFNLAADRQWATGAVALQREVVIAAPTYSFVGGSTITTAVTLDVSGPPIAGANATITNAFAARFGGKVQLTAGQILVPDGTAAVPPYSFTTDPNTGIYSYAGDSLGFATNGALAAYVNATGDFYSIGNLVAGASGTAIVYAGRLYQSSGFQLIVDCVAAGIEIKSGFAAANAGTDILIKSTTTRTDGLLLDVQNNGATVAKTAFDGTFVQTTIASLARTLSTEFIGTHFNFAATRQWATGAIATQREMVVTAPTYAFVGASVVTDAITVDITGAPIVGANATFTRALAFRVTGPTKLNGGLTHAHRLINDAAGAVAYDDYYVFYSAISAPRVLTLPKASTCEKGHTYILGDSSGSCTVGKEINLTPDGADKINGAAAVYPLDSSKMKLKITSDGVDNWEIC